MKSPQHEKAGYPDNLRTENEILKMKLMLEHGASLQYGTQGPIQDPVIEHIFLKKIVDFEAAAMHAPRITIFEKIGRPANIMLPDCIEPGRIQSETEKVLDLMARHGIYLSVHSPHVTAGELYRFITEELMQLEVPAHKSPGEYCFVYDEFYPDPYFENEQMAVEDCMGLILSKREIAEMEMPNEIITLNQHRQLRGWEFMNCVNRFKKSYRNIISLSLEAHKTEIRDGVCSVHGKHETGLCGESTSKIVRGDWKVEFHAGADGHWLVSSIQVGGIEFS